jgi:CheY-like chemotaxis protein
MSQKTILVIDDEKNLCTVIAACLESFAGWEVFTTTSAQEGVKLALTNKPDAILLDVMMPDMDGAATLKALKNNPDTAPIPVLFLTAKVQTNELIQLAELGVVGIISKPFDPLNLAQEVTDKLGW